jgi:hypothetical protein
LAHSSGKKGIAVNVSNKMLYEYIQVFNETFLVTGRQFLPENILTSLLRYLLIQGGIVGYISTQFGAGIEYSGEKPSGITMINSSSRIEDFFFQAPTRVRKLRGSAFKYRGRRDFYF